MNSRWQLLMIAGLLGSLSTYGLTTKVITADSNYRSKDVPAVTITEQKAISIAQQHIKGRVLAINYDDNIFRIKILTQQGVIQIILINGLDGTVVPLR
ncbi:MAG: peptidase [Nitrosomonas sp. PRO4]|nr:peptidase [Nitrosomonas sp. PRO4]